jgi:hypothetical protein
VNISKDQIIQLLESQGNHDQAKQAAQQLPDQVDTEKPRPRFDAVEVWSGPGQSG